ncbi:protoporphyrinogen/coproporphyrinogen oxidase [Streptomyces sp. NRRL B-1347]|uniref:protoporphyrinogen/coproporphyrinogen oxidase n=1 Tax=Streptomyces sp. NRRL B-1347 TaxID=1476877 RepID=UPI00131A78B3|nr:FAD-dependent oxidoreductase [Streptomyces sp. NRRL B-1347]
MSTTGRAIVVGAGVAGLTAGYRLREYGYSVTVLEQAPHLGGRMGTVSQGGFRHDLGALWMGGSYQAAVRLLEELGLNSAAIKTSNIFGIYRDGETHRFNSTELDKDLAVTELLSPEAKLRAGALLQDVGAASKHLVADDFSAAQAWDTESARSYALRRLDEELHDYLVEPIVSGMSFTSSDKVSAAMLLFLTKIFVGAMAFNFETGLVALPERLAQDLHVETNARVERVQEDTDRVHVRWRDQTGAERTEQAEVCVVAVQAPLVPGLLPHLTQAQQEYLSTVTYARDVFVHFGVDEPPAEPAWFVLVPQCEHPDLNYVSFDHHRAPGRAPEGKGLMRVGFRNKWCADRWQLDDAGVAANALSTLRAVFPDLADHIEDHQEMAFVGRNEHALLQRGPGDATRLRHFQDGLDPHSRIQLAGDFLSWSVIDAALATGESAARSAHRAVTERQP